MNIYIYGNDDFKKDIHSVLSKANIKYKLNDEAIIKNITNLNELKSTIKDSPNDIYLIDDGKIIKKDALSQKIKFLSPKDGIEEEFLLENGIADLSIDSLGDIPRYILLKYEQEKSQSEDIQSSIVDIVDEAYSEDIALDEELSSLLSHEEPVEEENEKKIEEEESNQSTDESSEVDLDRIDEVAGFEEDVGLNNIVYDYDNEDLVKDDDLPEVKENSFNGEDLQKNLDDILNEELGVDDITKSIEENFNPNMKEKSEDAIEDEKEDIIEDKKDEQEIFIEDELEKKGQDMSDEFSEFDLLKEEDILSALNDIEDKDNVSTASSAVEKKEEIKENNNENLELDSSNISEVSQLISKLLNNKTLEITVKIKD